MILSFLLVAVGFVALIFGANWLVNGASSLAKKYHVSDLAIGLTIVAFGTSAPELVVNLIASVQNHTDIVFGNIIGSNNFNLFIILGISGLISPIVVKSSTAWKEIPLSLVAALLLLLMANDFFLVQSPVFSRVDGIILLVLFGFFLYYVFRQMRNDTSNDSIPVMNSNLKIWASIIFGLAGLMVGGQMVVKSSIDIAQQMGVSEKIIALTIVAAGTSLPELLTSVVAALKKNSDIAIGNVIGSNIFNVLLILATSAVIRPMDFNIKFNTDIYILLGGTAFLILAMITGKRKKLDRWEATILLTFYVFYTVLLIKGII